MTDDQQRNGASPLDVLDRLRAANPNTDVIDPRNDLRARLDLDRILIGDITGGITGDITGDLGEDDTATDALLDVRPLTRPGSHPRKRHRPRGPSDVRPVWRRPLPWVAAAVAAVVAAGAIGVAVLQPGPAPLARADTPPALAIEAPAAETAAADLLRRSAVLALQQQALPAATWRYSDSIEYSTVTSFYRRDGKDVQAVQVVPSRNQFWLAADGTAHEETVTAGGSSAWSSDGTIDTSLIDPAGVTSEDFDVASRDSTLELPTDPAALTSLLDRQEPAPRGGRVAAYLDDLYNRMRTGLPTPAQQSALWQVLADTGAMSYLGTTADRAGRQALVVGYDTTGELAGQKRYQLLLDPQTGLLLAHEEIALKTSPMWPQQAPAVMGGTTWLATASTDTLDVPATGDDSPRG